MTLKVKPGQVWTNVDAKGSPSGTLYIRIDSIEDGEDPWVRSIFCSKLPDGSFFATTAAPPMRRTAFGLMWKLERDAP